MAKHTARRHPGLTKALMTIEKFEDQILHSKVKSEPAGVIGPPVQAQVQQGQAQRNLLDDVHMTSVGSDQIKIEDNDSMELDINNDQVQLIDETEPERKPRVTPGPKKQILKTHLGKGTYSNPVQVESIQRQYRRLNQENEELRERVRAAEAFKLKF
jgi:hypothetical protein